jgi:hypothetical protein
LVLSPGLSILLAERRGVVSRLSGGESMENGGWRVAVSRESTRLSELQAVFARRRNSRNLSSVNDQNAAD